MTIPLFWHASDNFGDALAPWLVKAISGEASHYVDPYQRSDVVPYLVTGSIFKHDLPRGIIWGAGCAFQSDLNPAHLRGPSDDFRVVATRGPLSAELARAAGHEPQAVGDPAFLLPKYYTPHRSERAPIGVICSWVDYAEVVTSYPGVPVLNASTKPLTQVIDTITSWDVVVSSCLHGLVAAVAYGKPCVWAQFSDKMMGDGFKFRDFFALFDWPAAPLLSPTAGQLDAGVRIYAYEDADTLYDCCPFR